MVERQGFILEGDDEAILKITVITDKATNREYMVIRNDSDKIAIVPLG